MPIECRRGSINHWSDQVPVRISLLIRMELMDSQAASEFCKIDWTACTHRKKMRDSVQKLHCFFHLLILNARNSFVNHSTNYELPDTSMIGIPSVEFMRNCVAYNWRSVDTNVKNKQNELKCEVTWDFIQLEFMALLVRDFINHHNMIIWGFSGGWQRSLYHHFWFSKSFSDSSFD